MSARFILMSLLNISYLWPDWKSRGSTPKLVINNSWSHVGCAECPYYELCNEYMATQHWLNPLSISSLLAAPPLQRRCPVRPPVVRRGPADEEEQPPTCQQKGRPRLLALGNCPKAEKCIRLSRNNRQSSVCILVA